MKHPYIILTALIIGCAPSNITKKEPTPFTVGSTKVIVEGCEKLKREVEEWNVNNPEHLKQADC